MAAEKEFVVVQFSPGIAGKIEKLYNEGYRKWRHFSNDKHSYIVFKKVS